MKPIYVTEPDLPPLDRFTSYLNKIWQSKQITNNGDFCKLFTKELKKFLNISNLSLINNGTIGLLIALKSLNLKGKVITTPYSFIATSHCLLWNDLEPIFVDTECASFNIDPYRIEQAITEDTSAILAVHCYGNPCAIDKIDKIAKKYNLKVIYDAAHSFGIKYKNKSILEYGDLSILSFHATKVFNTVEGGAICSNDKNLIEKSDFLRNFGYKNETTIEHVGINGKLSELNSAYGLLQLNNIDQNIDKRRNIHLKYIECLQDIKGISLYPIEAKSSANYSYFPILINDNFPMSRDYVYEELKKINIFSKRYFYPLISNFPMYKNFPSANYNNLPCSNYLSNRILCLPIHSKISNNDFDRIVNAIRQLNKK